MSSSLLSSRHKKNSEPEITHARPRAETAPTLYGPKKTVRLRSHEGVNDEDDDERNSNSRLSPSSGDEGGRSVGGERGASMNATATTSNRRLSTSIDVCLYGPGGVPLVLFPLTPEDEVDEVERKGDDSDPSPPNDDGDGEDDDNDDAKGHKTVVDAEADARGVEGDSAPAVNEKESEKTVEEESTDTKQNSESRVSSDGNEVKDLEMKLMSKDERSSRGDDDDKEDIDDDDDDDEDDEYENDNDNDKGGDTSSCTEQQEEKAEHSSPPPPPPPPVNTPLPATDAAVQSPHISTNNTLVYNINEIGSLSNPEQRQRHNRKVRSAHIVDAIGELENNVGLEDRWAMREDVDGKKLQSDEGSEEEGEGVTMTSSSDVGTLPHNKAKSQAPPSEPDPKKEETPENSNNSSLPNDDTDHVIDVQELRRLSSQGIPDLGSHRAVAWRVLLGYLPPDTGRWVEVLARDRGLYRNLVSELFVHPSHEEGADSGGVNGNTVKRVKGGSGGQNKIEGVLVVGPKTKSPVHTRDQMAEGRKLRGRGMEKDGVSVRDLRKYRENSGGILDAIDSSSDDTGALQDSAQDSATTNGKGPLNLDTPSDAATKTTTTASLSPSASESDLTEGDLACIKASSAQLGQDGDGDDIDGDDIDISNTENQIHNNQATRPNKRASARAREIFVQTKGPLPSLNSIQERKQITSNNANRVEYTGKNAPIPRHRTEAMESLVPARVREQWKKSGRDLSNLDSISATASSSVRHINALLVVDDQGFTPDGSRPERVSVNDDPLSLDTDSKWAQFFENASLLDEIRKDVVRTHPDLHFFLEPMDNLGQRRYAAIERILFVWAKLNKGVRYVQGMNEIVGTIYFVLANDSNEEWACEAEADTYFLFNTLMVEMRDVFVPDLDDADTGIQGRISNMISLLSLHDPEVRCHLDDCGIDASFYSIRWLTTLLSREFILPDTIRLWDSMFASTHKDNFLRYVCVTMVMIIREDLLRGDFGTCLRLLQQYPPTNVDRLLESSRALWIYESQVTLACHKGGIGLTQALVTIAPPPSIIMAYGLPGGVAHTREERIRQAGEKGLVAVKGAAKEATNTVATAGKSFFGSAKGLWGEWRSSGKGSQKFKRDEST